MENNYEEFKKHTDEVLFNDSTMDGSLVKYLKKEYSKEELKKLEDMFLNEEMRELAIYVLDGDLELADIDPFYLPYEDMPTLINDVSLLNRIISKWRLSIGH